MTDLQAMYQQLRDAGRGHAAALDRLARRLEVDVGTIQRTLQRADKLDRYDPHKLQRGGGMSGKAGRR